MRKACNNSLIQMEKLMLDSTLEKRLSDIMNNRGKKIQMLSDEFIKNPDCLKYETEITRLAVIVKSLEKTKAYYNHLRISDKIFYDTMSDIRIWCENSGNKGLNHYEWLSHHIKGELFRIGRLQYQPYICKTKALDYDRLPLSYGETVMYIHIPQGEKLLFEDCRASMNMAREFFKTYFPDFAYRYFFCESWLLFNGNSSFMSADSNIMKFSSLFQIVYSDFDDTQAIERIFGKAESNIDNYPEKTSLQKAAKKYMRDGNSLGTGIGLIAVS